MENLTYEEANEIIVALSLHIEDLNEKASCYTSKPQIVDRIQGYVNTAESARDKIRVLTH